jgi:Ca2+-binding EF-hand superfamily protein
MMEKLIAAGCVLLLSASPVFADDMGKMDKDVRDPAMHGMKWKFGELDANKDKKISRQELVSKGAGMPEAAFEKADANKDGALDEQEFAALSKRE